VTGSIVPDSGGIPDGWQNQRFEAVVFDWDATALPGGEVEARELRRVVGDLCAAGMVVAVVAHEGIDEVDGQVATPPAGGRLLLSLNDGTESFEVDAGGPRPVEERSSDEARESAMDRSGAAGGLTTASLDVVFRALWHRGISPGAVLVAPPELGAADLLGVLEDQLRRRRQLHAPRVRELPGWTLTIKGLDSDRERGHESLLTLADGRFGTRGSSLWAHEHPAATPAVFAAGVYAGHADEARLLCGPRWNHLPGVAGSAQDLRRTLDLRSGSLEQVLDGSQPVRAFAFSSRVRPGMVALRAEGSTVSSHEQALGPPIDGSAETGGAGGAEWMRVAPGPGSMLAAASDSRGVGSVDRLAAYAAAADRVAQPEEAMGRLAEAQALGFDVLLDEHRQEWARRWDRGDVEIEGDDDLRLAVRFGLFHLMSSVASRGEAAVGARGLSGEAYRGHVFWDADVFVLPFLAATHPASARAMLEYRIRRLDAAMGAARAEGAAGASFPWESALTGEEVTPTHLPDPFGRLAAVRTGLLEVHIVADVAWAAAFYEDWTGDEEFAGGPGLRLLVETARYWASRIRRDSTGRGHIYGVMGPDEYHEAVDDNAFTNVMARWNLRRAAAGVRARGGDEEEARRWSELADRLVDGYDVTSGIYEQFTGFRRLEPLIIAEAAPRRPVAAELLFGWERVRDAQVVKQADVLMLYHLLPDEVATGSLEPNVTFYEPRTAHGSSLSPAVHAALLARVGRVDEAVALLKLAARLDLDDVTGTTAGGLHVACMGGVWQALVFGFLGARVAEGVLHLRPVLPPSWRSLRAALTIRGSAVRLKAEAARLQVETGSSVALDLGGSRFLRGPGRTVFCRTESGWAEERTNHGLLVSSVPHWISACTATTPGRRPTRDRSRSASLFRFTRPSMLTVPSSTCRPQSASCRTSRAIVSTSCMIAASSRTNPLSRSMRLAIPVTRLFSPTTTNRLIRFSCSSRAASDIEVCASIVITGEVITSRATRSVPVTPLLARLAGT
jgi:trehalose/maltose hydrolase-like predicted phosphorylase